MANSREEQMRMARQLQSEFGKGIGRGGGRGGGRGSDRGGRGTTSVGGSRPQMTPRTVPPGPFQRLPTGRAQQGGRGVSRSRPFSSFRDDYNANVGMDSSSSDQHNPLIVYYNDDPTPALKKPRVEDAHTGSGTLTPPTFSNMQVSVAATSNISTVPRGPVLQPAQAFVTPPSSNLQPLHATSAAATMTASTGLFQANTAFNGLNSAFPPPQAQTQAQDPFPTGTKQVASTFNNHQQNQRNPAADQMHVGNTIASVAVAPATSIVTQSIQSAMETAAPSSAAPMVEGPYQNWDTQPKPELEEIEAAVNMSKDQSIIWYYNEEPPRPMTPKPTVEESPVKYSSFSGFGYRKGRRYENDTFVASSFFDGSSPPAIKPPPVFYLDEQPSPNSAAQDPNCTCNQATENIGLVHSRHADPGQQLAQHWNFASTSCPVHFNQEHIYGEGYLTRHPAMS